MSSINNIAKNKIKICNTAEVIEFIDELNNRWGKVTITFVDPSKYYRDWDFKQAMYSYEEYKNACTY